MTTTKAALAIALMLGAAGPALAQGSYERPVQPQVQTPAPPAAPAQPAVPQRQYNLSRAERTAFQPVFTAVAAGDWAAATAALPAAEAAAQGNDAKYLIGQVHLQIGINTQNRALQSAQAQQRAGQPIPADWRRQLAALAYQTHSPDTMRYFREWLTAAPSPSSWHDVLALYADANATQKLDTYRLMRAAGALTGERDFIELAEAANGVRAFGEVKAVLEDGLRRNLIGANAGYARDRIALATQRAAQDRPSLAGERTAALAGRDGTVAFRLGDAYYGYGDYAEAAELYRAALQKGFADSNLGNLRLGAALALAGQRAPAEAAF